jgi:hypothetical protein
MFFPSQYVQNAVSAIVLWLIFFYCFDKFKVALFFCLIQNISAIVAVLLAGRERERGRERGRERDECRRF